MPLHYVTIDLDVAHASFTWAARHLQGQMLRNFATPWWKFTKGDGMTSLPGCIIASPSLPDHADTDQDYGHFWIRDGAVCVVEAIDNQLPGNSVLDDYVTFSRRCQETAAAKGCPDRACFTLDGQPREGWTDQRDGVAHRIDSMVDVFNRLSPASQDTARQVMRADLEHLLEVYGQPTTNLWEEVKGRSFFARSVQQRALRRAILEPEKLERPAALVSAASRRSGSRPGPGSPPRRRWPGTARRRRRSRRGRRCRRRDRRSPPPRRSRRRGSRSGRSPGRCRRGRAARARR